MTCDKLFSEESETEKGMRDKKNIYPYNCVNQLSIKLQTEKELIATLVYPFYA
jgi:hypothetical protein